jgi:hypothetical protein
MLDPATNKVPDELLEVYPPDSFDYAASLMSHGFLYSDVEKFWVCRDPIFKNVLETFDKQPVKIFQVGAIETLSGFRWRVSSGWSDVIWGDYINKYGGQLSIADVDIDHLAHSALIGQNLGYPVKLLYGDGADRIKGENNDGVDYDIYYLDGGNDPQETLDQYLKVKDQNCVVIIDDYSIKGTLIDEDSINITKHDIFNGIAVIDLR